jgi:hypothetical protein
MSGKICIAYIVFKHAEGVGYTWRVRNHFIRYARSFGYLPADMASGINERIKCVGNLAMA